MAEDTEAGPQKATEEELEVAFEGPAPGANRFFISLGYPGVRIAFAEQEPSLRRCFFRSAVTLHPTDAILLQRALKNLLSNLEPQFEAAMKSEGEAKRGEG